MQLRGKSFCLAAVTIYPIGTSSWPEVVGLPMGWRAADTPYRSFNGSWPVSLE